MGVFQFWGDLGCLSLRGREAPDTCTALRKRSACSAGEQSPECLPEIASPPYGRLAMTRLGKLTPKLKGTPMHRRLALRRSSRYTFSDERITLTGGW